MLPNKIISVLDRLLSPVNWALQNVAAAALAIIMFLTAFDVSMRNFFDFPIIGAFDLTEYLMAILVAFGLGYCAITKSHINADIVVARLPLGTRNVIGVFTVFVSLIATSIMTWQSFVHMKSMMASKLASSSLYIPVFPFIAIVGIGMALFSLVLVKDLLELLFGRIKT